MSILNQYRISAIDLEKNGYCNTIHRTEMEHPKIFIRGKIFPSAAG